MDQQPPSFEQKPQQAFFYKIMNVGLDAPYDNDFSSFKVRVSNFAAIAIPVTLYSLYFIFIGFYKPNLTDLFLFSFSAAVLYFNSQKRYSIAKYILVIGFTLIMLKANLTFRNFYGVTAIYVLSSLACGTLFDSRKGRLISFFICLACFMVASTYSLENGFSLSMDHDLPGRSLASNPLFNFFHTLTAICLVFLAGNFHSESLIKNEKMLKMRLERISNLEHQKSNYFSNTAHELKTPLTLILGHANFLLNRYDHDATIQKGLLYIQKNANYLKGFTRQILNLIRTDDTRAPLDISRFRLRDLIQSALTDFDIAASSKKINFQKPIFIPDIEIISDVQKLSVVLNNILSNAFKYTQSGGLISINVTELENAVQVIVQDDGRGIKKEDLGHVFDLYFQTSDADSSLLGGTGIGLTICKEYIDSLGGRIDMESEWGKGSSFIITFLKRMSVDGQKVIKPYVFDKNRAARMTSESLSFQNDSTHTKHILIVEDNLELCDFLKTILKDKYRLDFVYNGAEALDYLEGRHPDLIISDVMMPLMNGMELLQRLKSDNVFNGIPVLMLTAKTDLSTQSKALRIGVDDYLLKPFDTEVLIAHIEGLLELAENRSGIESFSPTEILSTDDDAARLNVHNEPNSTQVHPLTAVAPKASYLKRQDQIWLSEFEEVVSKLITDINLDLEQAAKEMNISKTHLNRRVNSLLGISPKRYIREVRLNKAKKMLEDQEYNSVKAVAYSVGFKSEKVFSRNFKARFGKCPSEYHS